MFDETFPQLLHRRLQQPLPGARIHRQLSPELSYGRHRGPVGHATRDAAVVVPLRRVANSWHVIMTKRSSQLAAHAGQISFPGGRVDDGETPQEAALRELKEELGILPCYVDVLGQLTKVFVFASDFQVCPYVATVDATSPVLPSEVEVAEVLEIPLESLRGWPQNLPSHTIQRGAIAFAAPHLAWNGHLIWGATATILGEFAAILDECRDTA